MQRKHLPAILYALGLTVCSAAVYAHTSYPIDTRSLVTIPNLQPGVEFSFAALALKPAASNLNYVIFNKGLPIQSPSWTEKELQPDYDFAYEVGGRYIFPGGSDVSLTWTHLNSSSTDSTVAPNNNFFLGPDYEIGPDSIPIRNASGKVQFKYDVINLDAGQFVDFGRHVEMRFFGGLSDANLREYVKAIYSGSIPLGIYAGPFRTEQDVTAKFNGIGPRVGLDASYDTDYGVRFLGEAAVSALIGSSYSKTAYLSSAQELLIKYGQQTNGQFIKDKRVTQVIPGIDAKLGVSYKHAFSNCMILNVKAGYQAAVYINAINQYLPGSLVDGGPLDSGGIFVATMNHTQSNYSVQGPFLEASLQI